MITAMDKEAFVQAAWPVIGHRVSKAALLADNYETSRTSMGLPVAPDSDAIRMFRLVLAQGRSLIQSRNAIEARAVELLGDHPDYQLLRSVPGIGPINALAVLAEPGNLRRFRHHRQFLKLGRHGSGDSAVQPVPRQELDLEVWQRPPAPHASRLASQAAVLRPANSFRDKFERYIAQDRHNPDLRRKAYTAIAAEMARAIHAVIKSGEPCRPFFEGTSPGGRTPLCRAVETGP